MEHCLIRIDRVVRRDVYVLLARVRRQRYLPIYAANGGDKLVGRVGPFCHLQPVRGIPVRFV